MVRKTIAAAAVAFALAGATAYVASARSAPTSANDCTTYEPGLPAPTQFVGVIDNPYFPLPVGRTLVYRGVEEGKTQIDTVEVTDKTKVIQGITTTVVHDVVRSDGVRVERTFDWYAQDDQGNVWYLGEDTKVFRPNGNVDTIGSWQAGVDGAKPGIIMEADPQAPDAYRQECLAGQAEDMAWVVSRGGSVTVPYGRVHQVLRTLEFSAVEPNVVSEKRYAPGLGIAVEGDLHGGQELFELVRVSG